MPVPGSRSSFVSRHDFSLGQALGTIQTDDPNFHVADFHSVSSPLPSIDLTKRWLKTIEAVHLVRDQRATGWQELAFNARPFVLRGFPLRRPNPYRFAYTRRNGRFSLTIVGHP